MYSNRSWSPCKTRIRWHIHGINETFFMCRYVCKSMLTTNVKPDLILFQPRSLFLSFSLPRSDLRSTRSCDIRENSVKTIAHERISRPFSIGRLIGSRSWFTTSEITRSPHVERHVWRTDYVVSDLITVTSGVIARATSRCHFVHDSDIVPIPASSSTYRLYGLVRGNNG